VPKLCQNPIYLKCLELLFEREQVPQVVDIRHFRMELMESLERANILRNQQVAGSIPAGGSRNFLITQDFPGGSSLQNFHFGSKCAKLGQPRLNYPGDEHIQASRTVVKEQTARDPPLRRDEHANQQSLGRQWQPH